MSIKVIPAPQVAVASGNRQRLSGFLWAALSVGIFSGWFVVTRFSMSHELRIWDIMALRFGIGAILLLPFLFGGKTPLPPGAWREGILFAVLWGAPFVFLVGLGLQMTSAAAAAAISPALMPVFAGLMAWPLFGERPSRWRLLGYLVIVLGLTALVAGHARLHGWPSPAGLSLLIGAALTWGVYSLLFRRSGLSPLQASALICFWSAVFYVPIYVVLGWSRLDLASTQELIFQVIYQGLMMSVVATIAYNRAVTALGAAAAAAMIALLPVIVSSVAIPVLGEVPSWLEGIAIVVIAAGVIFAARPAPVPASP
ncbi:DMT family transporter [Tardiphaga sp. P9-11]|uniref:DMT family transporter n=1 Tax=Tardiphaga sp. P9-11 TaxID=2024614 RepID=UPI0011F1B6E1|nr:DMT family transporter [Tardiphaga sp. P9-11]KAA0073504.1 DMT family transporter [Tardiphaga sp. P9-11]